MPQDVFNQHFSQLKHIIKRRQSNLTQKQVLDKTRYQKGNLILAVNHPVKHDKETTSQELQMTVRGIYYVQAVHPAHLRVVGLFTGEERSLPREYCVKLSLANISQLQVQLEALQMQKLSSSLFRANKFLPANEAKTWNFLLNKGANQLDTSAINETLNDDNQNPECFLQPGDDENEDPEPRNSKVLRSGRAYFANPRAAPRSILKLTHLVPSCVNSPAALASLPDTTLQELDKNANSDTFYLPGHVNDSSDKVVKSISFDPTLNVRFLSGENPIEYTQDLLIQTEQSCVLPTKSALMLSTFSLDMSQAELCYNHRWSTPSPNNDLLVLE